MWRIAHSFYRKSEIGPVGMTGVRGIASQLSSVSWERGKLLISAAGNFGVVDALRCLVAYCPNGRSIQLIGEIMKPKGVSEAA